VIVLSSKKSKSNGRKNGTDRLYADPGPESIGSASEGKPDELNHAELEKHWNEIFNSPEFEQDLKESDFLDAPGKSRRPSGHISEILTGTFSNKLKILRETIREIEREIDERIELGKAFRKRIDTEVSKCKAMLKLIEDYTVGYNPTIEFRRLAFERQIFMLTKELRAEDLRAWEDIIALMRERRNLEMEYKALVNTRRMLSR
jgi:hypothetical protein